MWIICNKSFSFAFTEELQKSCNKIYHISINLLPHYLGKLFKCFTMHLYSKASQLGSNAKSFNYNKYLPDICPKLSPSFSATLISYKSIKIVAIWIFFSWSVATSLLCMNKTAISELSDTILTMAWDSVTPISRKSQIFPWSQSIYSHFWLSSLRMHRNSLIGSFVWKYFVTAVLSNINFL